MLLRAFFCTLSYIGINKNTVPKRPNGDFVLKEFMSGASDLGSFTHRLPGAQRQQNQNE